MDHFQSDDAKIAYSVAGSGKPILLLHGFAGHCADNWVRTGWIGVLDKLGRQVIMYDARGHGESETLYDKDQYGSDKMMADAFNLLDHLGIESADFMGFSMGGSTSIRAALTHPERVNQLMVLGVGDNNFKKREQGSFMGNAFEAESADEISTPHGKAFRRYADSLGQDLKALSAFTSSSGNPIEKEQLVELAMPMVWIVGMRDDVAGPLNDIEALLPKAHCITLPGIDHNQTVAHGMVKSTIVDFLTGHLDLPDFP